MTNELAIPDQLPATPDELVDYGRHCLRIGKIATEQFGYACQALLDGPGSWTQRRVAEAMGCSQSTVRDALDIIGAVMHKITSEYSPLKNDHEDADDDDFLDGEALDEDDPPLDDFEGEAEDEGNPEPVSKTSGPVAAQKIAQVITNEWYTPAKYIAAVRNVLGEIDLDPASSQEANEVVQATRFLTEADDGLEHPWEGRVWLNPPYGELGPRFTTRLIEEYQRGTVKEAIVLVNSNCVPTKWFRPLWNYLLCFHYGRINFNAGTEERTGSTHGSVFVYLGNNHDAFDAEFSQFGVIVQRRNHDA